MGILHIDDLEEGLELAEDVLSPQGMKIAGQGDKLTAKHMKAFKAWGIIEVTVLGSDEKEGQPADDEPKKEIPQQLVVQEIDHLFEKTNRNNPVITELYNLALQKAMAG